MQTSTTFYHSRWKTFKGRILAFLVSHLVSKHGKKVLYITSLYFHVARAERLKEDAIRKLNQLLKVAHRERALDLPVSISGYVWDNTDVDKVLTENLLHGILTASQAKALSGQVVDLTPKWIRFGTRDEMVRETFDLLRKGSQLAIA